MSTDTEDQPIPPSTNQATQALTEETITASAEVSIEDEWAAALAEQAQEESVPSAPEPTAAASEPEAQAKSTPAPTAEADDAPLTEAALEDDWAAALAEQADDETSAPEPTAAAREPEAQADPPSAPTAEADDAPLTEAALEDDWAAALAEQAEDDADDSTPKPMAAASEPEAQAELVTTNGTEEEAPPSTDASLEDDWAAALAEQSETDSPAEQDELVAASEETDQEAVTSPENTAATTEDTTDSDEELTNEWADVLEDQTSQPVTEASEAPQAEAQSPEDETEMDTSDKVVMNWPSGSAAQTQPDPPPADWKPTRLDGSSEETEPSPEQVLVAAAADASIQAVMERATDVAEVIQDDQARKDFEASASAENSTPPTTESGTSEPIAESATAPEIPDSDQPASHPEPPTPEASDKNTEQAPDRFRRPFFTGTGGSLFGMFTMNTLLTLLTFGVYSFWGRIKIRKYLHSQTKFGGARLAFEGTGMELFKGWMKAVVVFGIPYSALNYAGMIQTEATLQWGVNILAGLFILCFIPIAIVGSHRYRMSRTSWRGIYFSFRHSAKDFFLLYMKGLGLSILTLGIYYPVYDNAKRAFLVSGTHFGSREFGFDGDAKELGSIYFKAFRVLILGLITAEAVLLATSFFTGQANPTQVIDIVFWATTAMISMVIPFVFGVWFWFQAMKQRYMWNHTTFGPARFQATMRGRDLFELKSCNLLLLVCSLGMAWPWVQTRNLQFLYYHVGLQGPLNLKQVVQDASTASPMGEELAGFFDTGFDLG